MGLAVGGAAFAGFLARRHAGRGDDAPQYTRKRNSAGYAVVGRTVTIRKSRADLYNFWREFQNLPKFMENVESIESDGDAHVWRIKAPAASAVDIRTTVSEEKQNEYIAWKSVEGSDIETAGVVEFDDAPGERGTRVSLVIAYNPPAGAVGRTIAKAFLREPETQARHDLKRFKMLMETGEVATSARRRDQTRQAQQQENG